MAKMTIMNVILAIAVIFLTYQLYQSHLTIADLNRAQALSEVRLAELKKQVSNAAQQKPRTTPTTHTGAGIKPANQIVVDGKTLEELAEEQLQKEQGNRKLGEPIN